MAAMPRLTVCATGESVRLLLQRLRPASKVGSASLAIAPRQSACEDVPARPSRVAMVTVQVREVDAALQWYRDVLGLEVQWFEAGEFATLAAQESDTPVLAIATDHPERISATPGTGWTPTLEVQDLDAAVAELRSRGVVFDAGEEGADEGYRLVRVRDPEGNVLGITS